MKFCFQTQGLAIMCRYVFHKPGANIMTRCGVFSAWIAKTHNEFDSSQRLFLCFCLFVTLCASRFTRFFSLFCCFRFFSFYAWVMDAHDGWIMIFVDFQSQFNAMREFNV